MVVLKDVYTGEVQTVTRTEAVAFASAIGETLEKDQCCLVYDSTVDDAKTAFEAADHAKVSGV